MRSNSEQLSLNVFDKGIRVVWSTRMVCMHRWNNPHLGFHPGEKTKPVKWSLFFLAITLPKHGPVTAGVENHCDIKTHRRIASIKACVHSRYFAWQYMQIGRFTGHTSKISGRFPSLLMDDGSLLETTTPPAAHHRPWATKPYQSVTVSPDGFQMIPASWDKTALPARLCSLLSDSNACYATSTTWSISLWENES